MMERLARKLRSEVLPDRPLKEIFLCSSDSLEQFTLDLKPFPNIRFVARDECGWFAAWGYELTCEHWIIAVMGSKKWEAAIRADVALLSQPN
jgi:hypothetical protein